MPQQEQQYDLQRRDGETAVEWYNRLNNHRAEVTAAIAKAKPLASHEANEKELKRRHDRDMKKIEDLRKADEERQAAAAQADQERKDAADAAFAELESGNETNESGDAGGER